MPAVLTLQNPIRRKPPTFFDGLHLDFARGLYYSKAIGAQPVAGPLASFITTTRAGTATRITAAGKIEAVAADTARIDYGSPSGVSSVGSLLRESASANIEIQSETVGGAGWLNVRAAAVANAEYAPDDALTATLLVEDASNNSHFTRQDVNPTAGVTYVKSIFAKPFTRSKFALHFDPFGGTWADTQVAFDLVNGQIINLVGAPVASGMQRLANGWVRCWIAQVCLATALSVDRCYILQDMSSLFYQGDGVSGLYLWGYNFSPLPVLSSYVPSGAAPVTRNADRYFDAVPGAWFTPAAFTLGAKVRYGDAANGSNQMAIRVSDNSYNNAVVLNGSTTGFIALSTASGGVFDGLASTSQAITDDLEFAAVGAYEPNSLACGRTPLTTLGTDASATAPAALTRFDYGCDQAGANGITVGRFKSLHVWPGRMTNAGVLATLGQL
jgi:hypothetical protein